MSDNQSWAPPQTASAAPSTSTSTSTGSSTIGVASGNGPLRLGALLTVVSAVFGVAGPFLLWIDTSAAGFDSGEGPFSSDYRAALEEVGAFPHVGILALLSAGVALVVGMTMLIRFNSGGKVSRPIAGLSVLAGGIGSIAASMIAFDATEKLLADGGWDNTYKVEDVMGIGLALTILSGFALFVSGIIVLSNRRMTGN